MKQKSAEGRNALSVKFPFFFQSGLMLLGPRQQTRAYQDQKQTFMPRLNV